MSDITCAVCGVPKPPVCYEHSGGHNDTCQPYMSRLSFPRSAAWKRSPVGKASAKRTRARMSEADSDRYASKVAAWVERRGL